MIDIKLIVLFIYVVYSSIPNNYCDICRNHTLCLFNEEGPNVACKSYNNTALTRMEINEIVNRINERRNYIALGLNKILPHAANMKKVSWSFELATFAQRWVDQCDQALQPDKEDQCRDLAHNKVGQNIATILGPSPGLNVKSFVEMWYIQIQKYKGPVTYYNQSRHHNSDYLTQLIWAETDSVGCGKARFYVESKNIIVERLICNFAPKGNIHGKPVYTIGYPSTQCPNNMIPDRKYTALCVKLHHNTGTARSFTTLRSHVSSVLRILNLSNSSVKQEIDPIRNNLKQINNTSYSKDQRNQKLRHVYFNHTHGDIKRAPLRKQNLGNPSMNLSYINNNEHRRGHSQVYHGYESHVHNHNTHDENNYNHFRKFDFSTDSIKSYSYSDSVKYMDRNYQCTRGNKRPSINNAGQECNTPLCTRGQMHDNCHQLATVYHSNTYNQKLCMSTKLNYFNEFCSRNKYTHCYTTPTRCDCGIKCGCLNVGITTCCPDLLRMKQNVSPGETKKSQEYKLYDLPAPLIVRSGNYKLPTTISSQKSNPKYIKPMNKNNYGTEYKEYHEQVKDLNEHQELNVQDRDYLYETFDSSGRNRRDLEEHITFMPFWEIDQYNHNRRSELKSLRYTTLGHKKHKKTKQSTISSKPIMITESITITSKNTPITRAIKDYISEKFLSFDELMRLRKFTNEETYQYARRKASDENILREDKSSSSSTTEITTNTPFVRKKHCTRKLTCTWTALTMSGGEMIAGGGGFDRGSRTPPGYVEGCTRTSTCTREFMDRNKISTIPDTISSEPTIEDEDYCERRALKRNLEEETVNDLTIDYRETNIEPTVSTTDEKHTTATFSTPTLDTLMFVPQYGCVCSQETSRIKRDKHLNTQQKYKDYKYLIRKMSIENGGSLRHMHRQNSISYFPNIKCPRSSANILKHTHYVVLWIVIVL